MITVVEINDIDQLASYRLLWREMLGKTPRASFFQSSEWLSGYLRHLGDTQKLRALIISVAGKPIGIVPLVVKPVESRLGTLRVLTYPIDGWGWSYGPIGKHTAATLVAAMRYLKESPRDWDLLDFRSIDTDRIDRGRTRNAMRSVGLKSYQRLWDETSVIKFPSTWKEYWSALPNRVRESCSTAEERLSQQGTISLVRYRPAGTCNGETDRRWDLFNDFEKLAIADDSEPHPTRSNLQTIRKLEFLRDVHVAAIDDGALDLNLLYLDRKPIACSYNYHQEGRIEVVRSVANPKWGHAATTLLMSHMLRNSIVRGDSELLFSNDLSTMKEWQTSTRTTSRCTHFSWTAPRAQMLRLNHCLKSWLGEVEEVSIGPVAAGRTSVASTSPSTKNTSSQDRSTPNLTVVS